MWLLASIFDSSEYLHQQCLCVNPNLPILCTTSFPHWDPGICSLHLWFYICLIDNWWEHKEERGDRGWDCWMASLTQQTWVWANSGRWWRIRKPSMLQPMGSQSDMTYDWTTTMRTYCIAQGVLLNALWWSEWEESPKGRGYMYIYGWFSSLYSRN